MDANTIEHRKPAKERSDAVSQAAWRRAEQAARVAAMVAREHGYRESQALAVFEAVRKDLAPRPAQQGCGAR